ncbi:MAG: DNA polymerase III subunit delta' [Gammaproteobacteria bacterium]|nr:DNA polymerase III subunit delta' [Gammaproteobacteria bacterium]
MSSAPFPWQNDQWQRLLRQIKEDRLAHAYLLTGDRGLGKRAFASAAAQLLLCEQSAESRACETCRSCELFSAGSNPDLMLIEPESSQVIKVDQIRELSNFSSKTSHGRRRKVLILDDVDKLNTNAANALLKTLEEPPGNTLLFLVTAIPGKLPATIRSRCQRVVFAIPEYEAALEWLQEQTGDQQGMASLLKQANGRPLLALQMIDGEEGETRKKIDKALAAVASGGLDPVEFSAQGKNIGPDKILEQLWYLTVTCIKGILSDQENTFADQQEQAVLQVLSTSTRSEDELLARLLAVNGSVDEARKQLAGSSNPNPQLLLEGILWRWSRLTR